MNPDAQQPQQSISPQPTQSQVPQAVQKSSPLPRIVLTILGVVIMLALLGGAYYIGTQKNPTTVSNEKIIIPTKTVTTVPTIFPTVTSSPESIYQAGTEINNAKFSLDYPKGWQASLKENTYSRPLIKQIEISVIPPGVVLSQGQNFWGGFIVNVYPQQNSIEDYFTNILLAPDGTNGSMHKRSDYSYTTNRIGNKTAYYITGNDNTLGFVPRYVILGKYYAYDIGFFQNGENGFTIRIQNELFPTLNFQ